MRPCPACRSATATPALSVGDFSYVECAGCGTWFLEDVPSDDFLRELYQRHEMLRPPAVSTQTESRLPSLLRPHLWPPGQGRGRRILDIGCSSGRHLLNFRNRGWRVAGTDLDAAAIDQARAAMPDGEFQAGDLAHVEFSSAPFDVIRIDSTLEHVADPGSFVRRARTWLKAGGRVFIYVPHSAAGSIRIFGTSSINIWPPFHLQLFSRRGLKRLLSASGYTQVRCWGYSPRGIFGSSLVQWRHAETRQGAAPAPTTPARMLEASARPILATFGRDEEIIGIARVPA